MATQSPPEPGHWFLRGVQSAIFYYVSCSPCLELKYKRKRQKEAKDARTAVISAQPGIVGQPMAFQTNEAWAEDLMMGPGPPKGWKADELLERLKKKDSREGPSTQSSARWPVLEQDELERIPTARSSRPTSSDSDESSSSSEDEGRHKAGSSSRKPSMERRLSNAMENFKDSLRNTLHADRWNWRRYDREDETLWGFGEKVTQMWNRATATSGHDAAVDGTQEERGFSLRGRKRAGTNDTDRYDYRRARNPEVNELHPPVVSQLPATREQAQWMLLPPPSAGVMLGYKRPGAEVEMRWPMCVIGRPSQSSKNESGVLAHRVSVADDDHDRLFHRVSEGEVDGTESLHYQSEEETNDAALSPYRSRHLSDPIVKPLPAYTASSATTGDVLALKRRDSWHFYIHMPSSRSSMG